MISENHVSRQIRQVPRQVIGLVKCLPSAVDFISSRLPQSHKNTIIIHKRTPVFNDCSIIDKRNALHKSLHAKFIVGDTKTTLIIKHGWRIVITNLFWCKFFPTHIGLWNFIPKASCLTISTKQIYWWNSTKGHNHIDQLFFFFENTKNPLSSPLHLLILQPTRLIVSRSSKPSSVCSREPSRANLSRKNKFWGLRKRLTISSDG